jgi:hypothetical protein
VDKDLNARIVAGLRGAYRRGRLDILVGAGPSINSGLPSWTRLNQLLLSGYLKREYSELELKDQDLARMAERFVDSFGREPVVDLVRVKVTVAEYVRMLRASLYGAEPLHPSTLHYELASMLGGLARGGRGRLLTFNFDRLLETAYRDLFGAEPETVQDTKEPRGPCVVHLHGCIDERMGKYTVNRKLILSERDYYEASRGDWAAKKLRDALNDEARTVLLVGLSMGDQRLRRLLLERAARKIGATVVAILPEPQSGAPELADRLAYSFVRKHLREFWERWRINVLFVNDFTLVSHYLRRVRLGSSAKEWARLGRALLRARASYEPDIGVPPYTRLYEREVQNPLVQLLRSSLHGIRRRYGASRDEALQIGGFVPWSDGVLQLGFHYRGGTMAQDIITPRYARERELDVSDIERPQGVAGLAFVRGGTITSTSDASLIDLNFTTQMRKNWRAEERFQTLLCVPVYHSRSWVPVGVMYLTSASREPFWARLNANEHALLEQYLRTLFQTCLRYQ